MIRDEFFCLFAFPDSEVFFINSMIIKSMRFSRKIYLLLLMCIFPIFRPGELLLAQTTTDQAILNQADTNTINQLNDLGWELIFNDPDSAMVLVNQALTMSEKIKWKKGMANSYRILGVCHYLITDGSMAMKYYRTALAIEEELGNENGIARILNNIGLVYYDQGEYPQALEYYLRTLRIDEKLGDRGGMAATMANIGNIYEKQMDFPKALEYFTNALNISLELGDKNNCATGYFNIGTIYHEQLNFTKALEYYSKSAKIAIEIGNKNTLGKCFGNAGIVHFELGEYSKALEYGFKALEIAEELGDKSLIATELTAIGDVYVEKKMFREAEKYFKRAISICNEIGALETLIKINKYLSFLYKEMGQFELALKYFTAAMDLKDTVFNEEKDKEITRKEMNYEFDKKEAAMQAEQEKKDIVTNAELKRRSLQRNYFIIGFLMLGVFLVFAYRGYRQKQKANIIITQQKLEVEQQKHIIEEKNKGILDSITYARRIQQAKLPNKTEIFAALPESFILFKPKDIVSGDFYFFYKSSQSVIIAAADCTGHGVPGALMSMVGSEQLNEAVLESSDTSEILRQLNIGIKQSLRQSESEDSTRDGMDIAICSIIAEKNILYYAGANRPLWLIRKGQSILEEINATRKAIGGLTDNEQHFETHELSFQKGDTFYICSDGYADQFGGESGKKLMTKNLKEILVAIQNLSMKEQEKHLEDFIESWKSGIEQLDDILVIGVRMS
jgi:tetratricopeptide (TPR) repeat protein